MLVVRAAWPPAPWRPPVPGRAGAAPARAAGGGAIGTRVGLGAGASGATGAAAAAAATGAGAGISTACAGAGAGGAAGGATSAGIAAAGLGAAGAGGGAAGAGAGAAGALATGAATGADAVGAGTEPSARAAGTPMPGRTGLGATARFFTTSTCTVLDRPWLKDWRTLPASTVLPSSRRPPGRRLSLLLPASCSFWSLIRRFEPDHLIRIRPPKHPATLKN